MRNTVHVLGPVLLAGAFFLGCSDDSSSAGGGQPADPVEPTPEAGAPDATNTGSITVNITRTGQPARDVVVVFNDAEGAILETVRTGANGQAVSSGAVPAQASLLLGGASSTRVVTYTALVGGDVINHSDDSDPSGEEGAGTYSITVPELANARSFRSVVGSCRTSWSGGQTTDLNLYARCVHASNTIIGTAFDDDGAVIGFSVLEGNATPGTGETTSIDLGAWQQPESLSVTIAGLTDSRSAYVQPFEIFGGQAGAPTYDFRVESNDPKTRTVPTVSGADGHQVLLSLEATSDSGHSQVPFIVSRVSATTTATSIDAGSVVKAVTDITLDASDARRVKFSWSGSPSATEATGLTAIGYFSDDRGIHAWEFVVPPGTSSVVAPVLPQTEAEAWLPLPGTDKESTSKLVLYSVDTVQSSVFANYRAFVRQLGHMTKSAASEGSRWTSTVLPTDGTLSFTTTYQATEPR